MNKCIICDKPIEKNSYCSRSCKLQGQNNNAAKKECVFHQCGKLFKPVSPNSKYCAKTHEITCSLCGKLYLTKSSDPKKQCGKCGRLLGKKAREKTNLEKYGSVSPLGSKEVQEKRARNNLEKYGVENVSQLEESKAKARKTSIETYGIPHYSQTEEFKEKIKATNLERYGVAHYSQTEEYKEKLKKTSLEKYGVEHHFKAESVQNKIAATNLKRYGFKNAFSSKEIRDKSQETILRRFGVKHPIQNENIKEKIEKTNQEKYGGISPFSSPEVREKASKTIIERYGDHHTRVDIVKNKAQETNIERYGVAHTFQAPKIRMKAQETNFLKRGFYFPSQAPEVMQKILVSRMNNLVNKKGIERNVSEINKKWAKLISETFNVKVAFEKPIDGKLFDLHIENTNILIEINPTISHNSVKSFVCVIQQCENTCSHKPIKNTYHFNKATIAKENGFSLVQIYDWDSKEDIINLLAGKLKPNLKKVSARKTTLKKISQKEANVFLKAHHFQKGTKQQTYCYGLFLAEKLVAVATFGKARFKAKQDFEWIRYAVHKEYIIHGASNYLWKAFVEEVSPGTVISYIDYDHTTAKNIFLEQCGFIETKPTGPAKIWSKKDKKISHNSLLAQGADRLLNTSYGSREKCGMGNEDIMLIEKWLPVYTSGNRVFLYTNSSQETHKLL